MLVCELCGSVVDVEVKKTGYLEGEYQGRLVSEPWYEEVYFCPVCGYVEAVEADLTCPTCGGLGSVDGVDCETCEGFGNLTEAEYEELH
jgi:RecJ-like exonuclease